MLVAAVDTTAVYVALIGAIGTITTAALGLLGVWLAARIQSQNAAKDQQITSLTERLEKLEHPTEDPAP